MVSRLTILAIFYLRKKKRKNKKRKGQIDVRRVAHKSTKAFVGL
jgi:hypothetical protein